MRNATTWQFVDRASELWTVEVDNSSLLLRNEWGSRPWPSLGSFGCLSREPWVDPTGRIDPITGWVMHGEPRLWCPNIRRFHRAVIEDSPPRGATFGGAGSSWGLSTSMRFGSGVGSSSRYFVRETELPIWTIVACYLSAFLLLCAWRLHRHRKLQSAFGISPVDPNEVRWQIKAP